MQQWLSSKNLESVWPTFQKNDLEELELVKKLNIFLLFQMGLSMGTCLKVMDAIQSTFPEASSPVLDDKLLKPMIEQMVKLTVEGNLIQLIRN